MIKLPKLTWEVDCAPLGYAGLTLTFWLNPSLPPALPETGEKLAGKAPPWETEFYQALGRILLEAHVPAELSDKGVEETVELGTAQAVYQFERVEPQLLIWGFRQYQARREERLKAELKN